MRNIRIALLSLVALVLTACGTISSSEVETNDLRTKIVAITTEDTPNNPVTELHISFYKSLNDVNLSPGDTVTARMNGQTKTLTVAETGVDLFDGTSYQATFNGADEINITLHRQDGDHTARIVPKVDSILGIPEDFPELSGKYTVRDDTDFIIDWVANNGDNHDDVAAGIRLDTCEDDDDDEFVDAMNAIYQYNIAFAGAEAKYGDETVTLDLYGPPGIETGSCSGYLLLNRTSETTDVEVNFGSLNDTSRAIFSDEIPINFIRTEQ